MKKQEIIMKVVNIIIDTMEKKNTLPWDKGIIKSLDGLQAEAISYATGKTYNGINRLILNFAGNPLGEYATFNYISKCGGKVKKNEKALPIVFYTMYNKEEKRPAQEGDKNEDLIPLLRMSYVFDVTSQVEWKNGFKSKRKELPKVEKVFTNEKLDSIINTFATNTNLKIEHIAVKSACYVPSVHEVHLFKPEYHKSINGYYSTAFHELIHSTSKGLKRELGTQFGSVRYSAEEIVAESGAMMLCNYFNITTELENSSVYVAHWAKHLKENPSWLFDGISKAEKAVDYFLKMAEVEQ